MDTDSAYMALSAPLEKIIRPSLKATFYQEYKKWFPRKACAEHEDAFMSQSLRGEEWRMDGKSCCKAAFQYDRRTPGLFKEEFSGDGIVALNSKTYYCWSEANEKNSKHSCKGLSKRNNALGKEHYLSVLRGKSSVSGVNKGFVKKNGKMRTYQQVRSGLTYFYAKRMVHEDGVTTSNLEC